MLPSPAAIARAGACRSHSPLLGSAGRSPPGGWRPRVAPARDAPRRSCRADARRRCFPTRYDRRVKGDGRVAPCERMLPGRRETVACGDERRMVAHRTAKRRRRCSRGLDRHAEFAKLAQHAGRRRAVDHPAQHQRIEQVPRRFGFDHSPLPRPRDDQPLGGENIGLAEKFGGETASRRLVEVAGPTLSTMRPLFMTTIRSARASASDWSCVT